MNTRSRAWTFTVNNFTVSDIELLKDVSTTSVYMIFGEETAPTTGTLHLQGYVYFESAKTFSKIQKLMPKGCHIEVAKGNPQQNKVYCSKEGQVFEYGTIPSQGKRNDIDDIKNTIASGGGMSEVIENAKNYQSLRTAELLLKYKEPPRNFKPYVVWIYGETGCGKTKKAYDELPNLFRKSNSSGKWWDGYDAHENVLIDDIKDNTKEMYVNLLELLDRYEVRVEHKGGSRQFLAKRIYVTSLYHPTALFQNLGNPEKELLRRIDKIIQL